MSEEISFRHSIVVSLFIYQIMVAPMVTPGTGAVNIFQSLPKYHLTAGIHFSIC